ncbi:MAG: mechanosensitive ion channel protein MscS [Spirochaetae bacterium HGW-Spirochaetae-3]|jgi:small-conductance mechanosensitive channel|nr:MAG: mechanosensitive ion channel protein MscS [Spirochaetae bacterium HGW-Spirochaetae-3]
MREFLDTISLPSAIDADTLLKVVYTVAVLIVAWLARLLFHRSIWKKMGYVQARYTVKKVFNYIVTALAAILIGSLWIADFRQVGTFFGLFSAGIAIALKDLFLNMAGWLFIVLRRPFSIGDRIQIGESSGDVIDIRLFQFTILEIGNWVDADQSTGRIVHIPNGQVFVNAQANYSKGFDYIWNELKVLVTFESDWASAKALLTGLATEQSASIIEDAKQKVDEAAKKYMILYSNLSPIVYTRVEDSGVLLTVRYLCKPRNRRNSENDLWERILQEFKKRDDIDLAYPTLRYYRTPADPRPR